VNFGDDTDLIIVAGTQVIPEFGGLSSVVLLVTVSLALATTFLAKLGNRKIPS